MGYKVIIARNNIRIVIY